MKKIDIKEIMELCMYCKMKELAKHFNKIIYDYGYGVGLMITLYGNDINIFKSETIKEFKIYGNHLVARFGHVVIKIRERNTILKTY